MKCYILSLIIFQSTLVYSQHRDSITPLKYRLPTVIGIGAATYTSAAVLLYTQWYQNYPSTSFHFHDDLLQWQQSDKFGHIFTAYYQARMWQHLLTWAGLKPKQTIFLSSAISMGTISSIELFDGLSAQWGASATDLIANGFGVAAYALQQLVYNRQIIKLKYSYSPQSYHDPVLEQRVIQLYGRAYYQRWLKDYNGTALWLSASIGSLQPSATRFRWLGAAIGIGSGGMYGATSNAWTNPTGQYIDYTHIPRYRSLYIAPDIDLEQIRTPSHTLKTLLHIANGLKAPLPALEISTEGKVTLHPMIGIDARVRF